MAINDDKRRTRSRKMFLAGAKTLEAKKEWINELNVFPVPDGDTGTNMTLTIMSAAKEVAGWNRSRCEDACQGHFFRIFKRRQRELRRHSFPAFQRIYKGIQGYEGD